MRKITFWSFRRERGWRGDLRDSAVSFVTLFTALTIIFYLIFRFLLIFLLDEKKLPFDEFDPYDDDDISIAATSSNNNIKRTKVGSLSLSHNQQYIYYLFSPTKVAMINILERRVMKVFGSEVIGQNITEIRMLTKKFMLTLNANRDYFKLCNIKECRKEGGVKLRDHESSQKSVKCVTFDVSKKGSKLVVAGQNEQKVCFLYVFKVTQTGFIQKFFNYNVAKISKVRLVERVYEPMNATFLLITSEHALHIFSVDNYQLRYLKSVKNVSKGKYQNYCKNGQFHSISCHFWSDSNHF